MDLTISGLQYDIAWENKQANIDKIESMLKDVPASAEIVLLPEMFTTGFSMNVLELAEAMDGNTVDWMKKTAKDLNKIIAGSIIIKEGKDYRNRFLWIEPDGNIQFYDKRHSFGLGDEDRFFTNGNKRVIIKYKDWKIFPIICYDLRFPAWIKNKFEYDLIINVANWPSVRAIHWSTFLKARAVENQSYIFGLNRVGIDAKNRHYSGDSSVIDYNGSTLNYLGETEGIISTSLSKEKLDIFRKDYPFLKDQDRFELEV